jgi:two-component system, OmpR family, sensor kinase
MFSAIQTALGLRSVRARLTFWYLLTLGVSLVGFAVFVYVLRAGTLVRELDIELTAGAHRFAEELRPALLELDVAGRLSAEPRAWHVPVVVRTRPGVVLFRAPAFPQLAWAAERDLSVAARAALPAAVTVRDRTGARFRVASTVVERPGADPLLVQVAAPTEPVRAALRQLALAMAFCIAVVLLLARHGSGFTARQALAPLDDIVARVEAIQAHAPGERLVVRAGSDETDRLVATLNRMLDRIEGSIRSARRFAADASHELQTPLAAIRAGVEGWLRDPAMRDADRAIASELLVEAERLSELVRDLRLLALAESGQLLHGIARVDLSELTRDCCEIVRALAEPKQIRVDARVGTAISIAGSAPHLRRAVLNLAVNAVRYSPEGSSVALTLRRAGSSAVLSVDDEGCGISTADLPHIFEPFYRADSARARETGGSGLGLAIVDQIVRLHGGRVEVLSAPGHGSRFSVYLPLAA